MATWTDVSSTVLEPGDPIRSVDIIAIKENIIAVPEGATGAPRIVGKAAKRFDDYPVLSVTAADTYSVGNGIVTESFATSTTSTSYVVARRYTIEKYTGSIRFNLSHRGAISDGPTYLGYLAIYKNNLLVQEYSTSSDTFINRTNDVSIVPGDVIEWRIRAQTSLGVTSTGNRSELASNGYTRRDLFIAYLDEVNP